MPGGLCRPDRFFKVADLDPSLPLKRMAPPMNLRPDPNIGKPAWKAREKTGAPSASVASAPITVASAPVLLAFAVAALGGCSLFKGSDKPVAQACPQVAILRDLAEQTQFRPGQGRDLTDVVSRAELADFSGSCAYHDGSVDVQVKLTLAAEKGPALRGQSTDYTYFVAITDPSGAPIAKQEFKTSVDFKPNVTRAGSVEELTQDIPLAKPDDGRNYRVLLGFQLTEDQLAFNRSGRRF